jgi:hypothetical protein
VVYDNACNLQKFLENRTDINSSQRLKDTASLKFVVDRLHIQGHTEQWCQDHCNPVHYPELLDQNTIICEQVNFWLGKYKYITKHMNMNRFNFYLYIILNEYNKIKCDGKFSVIDIPVNFVSNKRKINEISTDNEEVSDESDEGY